MRRYYWAFDHYRPVTRSGAVPIAENESELIAFIDRQLSMPRADSDRRKMLAREICGFTDGQCVARIADAIRDTINGRQGTEAAEVLPRPQNLDLVP
jgi:hypothetical protein